MNDKINIQSSSLWLQDFCKEILTQEDYLNILDSATGDGEHGSNMANGAHALFRALENDHSESLGEFFENMGMTIINSVGGASGALYGTLFLRLSEVTAENTSADVKLLARAFQSGLEGIMELGRVKPGDKTLVDSLEPAVNALIEGSANSETLLSACTKAHVAADEGRAATAEMEAQKGRGSYQGLRSIGHIDPGATSMARLFGSLAYAINLTSKSET